MYLKWVNFIVCKLYFNTTNQKRKKKKPQKSDYITCMLKIFQWLPFAFMVKVSKAFSKTSKILTFLTLCLASPISFYATTLFHFLKMVAQMPSFFFCFTISHLPVGVNGSHFRI